jgi:hypothetical protein
MWTGTRAPRLVNIHKPDIDAKHDQLPTMDEYEEAVLFTFALLESRLDRLEYTLGGAKKEGEKPKTVAERMHRIEKSLQELSAKTVLLNDARELCMSPRGYGKMET